MRKSHSASAALVAVLAIVAASPAEGAERSYEVRDCRYSRGDPADAVAGSDEPLEGVLLPDSDVFRPILADQREPRFYADYHRVHFRSSSSAVFAEGKGRDLDVAMVSFGGEFGFWGLRQPDGCDGLQVSLFGVVFSQFNLDASSADLLNADYLVGPMLTYRRGPWSARFRIYHQSSHLGDEFLLNYGLANGVQRQNLSIEALDLIVSVEDGWWRLFGGSGVIFASAKPPDLTSSPVTFLYGVELRGPAWGRRSSSLRPVFGAAFSNVQATGWSLNGSLEGGVEWAAANTTRRIRVLAVAQRGALPFSQFFSEQTENVGLQLQCEF